MGGSGQGNPDIKEKDGRLYCTDCFSMMSDRGPANEEGRIPEAGGNAPLSPSRQFSKNRRALIDDKPPRIFYDAALTRPMEVSLPPDSEMELTGTDGKAVTVILPGGAAGFIESESKVTIVKKGWLAQERADVQSQPSLFSSVKRTFSKGDEFSLLNTVDRDGKRWIRIRDNSGANGFVLGDVIVITEDSLIEAIGQSVGKGAPEEAIVTALTERGVPRQVVADGYAHVQAAFQRYEDSPEVKAVLASKYARHMLYGALWAIGGGIATAIGYSSASSSSGGGTYIVFWGAIVFGIYDFFKGLSGWSKYSQNG
jgi:hypothetical protein